MRPDNDCLLLVFCSKLETRRAMHLASPFGKLRLATQTEALEEGLITLVGGQLEVVEQFATTCDHLEKATTCGVIFLMRGEMLRQCIDPLRQEGHLDVGAAGVLVVNLERSGIDGGGFAHGGIEWPDNLSGGVCSGMWGREGTIEAFFGKEKFWPL